uniref:Protein kinase domain-containing protein n=1 Tax=Chenopodium quinoa TaxID=63459 RepID=A0A803LG15_CHEQI
MGNCWGSPAETPTTTPSTTGNVSSGVISQTTSLTSSSNISTKSQFSASSGDDVYPNGQILPTPYLREYSFQEMKSATRNFKGDNLLGEGGFGRVYKGWLENKHPPKSGSGLVVAIKKLNSESVQGGSAVQPLPWDLRLKIIIGAARGIAFLHSSDDRVIYRDTKASNILLDGVSKFILRSKICQSHVTTRVMGSYGYAAPEYIATGHLYVKSDVYGFGVVIVELLTGLRALDANRPTNKQTLVDWIKPHLSDKRKLKGVMDTRLEGKYPSKAALATAELALSCLAHEPRARPSMQEVLESLVKIQGIAHDKPRVCRRNSAGSAAVRPHGHRRQNGIRSQPNSLQSR